MLIRFAILFSLLPFAIGHAVDLDYRAAEQAYRRQQQITDQANQRLEREKARYEQAQSSLSHAKAEETRARDRYEDERDRLKTIDNDITNLENQNVRLTNDLSNLNRDLNTIRTQIQTETGRRDRLTQEQRRLERELDQIQRRIRQLESQPQTGPWTCVYVDHGHEEHSGGHRSTNDDRAKADADAKAACLKLHGKCDLARCSQPDSAELAQLRQREREKQRDLNETNNELNQVNNKITNLQNEERDYEDRVRRVENQIHQNVVTISSLQRDRDRQLLVINDAQDALRRAQDQVRFAQNNVNQIWPEYQAADREYREEARKSEVAYAYYQEVLANYNAALNAVYASADSAASTHSYQEAQERAPGPGKDNGKSGGLSAGNQKGLDDAAQRDLRLGFLDGLKLATTEPSLSQSYQGGIALGTQIASQKASAEDLPKAYNAALSKVLSSAPAQTTTIDISESISTSSGGSGLILDLKNLAVGSVAAPTTQIPAEPSIGAPAFSDPGVSVPSVLNLHFNPPCTGLVLAEFEPMCRDRYQGSYSSYFDSYYRSLYLSAYKQSFEGVVQGAYESALAKVNVAAQADGKQKGARAQGVSDGFVSNLAALQLQKAEEGRQKLTADLKTGAYLVLKSAALEETSGDGVFTPGEKVKLSVTIDNLGLDATALEKVRVTVTGVLGAKTLNFTIRDLPALDGNTRTTLTGVVTAEIATQFPKDKIKVSSKLEAWVDGRWKTLATTSAEAETHFPVEISDIKLSKDPKVDEVVPVAITVKNMTRSKKTGGKLVLGSSPAFVTFPEPEVTVPDLEADQSVELSSKLKATAYIPENGYVTLTGKMNDASQSLAKTIHVDRHIALLLYDGNGSPVPSSTLKVKAGATFGLAVKAKYLSQSSLPGPFTIAAVRTSDPGISTAAGSTTAINYGSLSPNYPFTPMNVYYRVDASLKGKTGWVMLTASEGNKNAHILMVYLEIE